MLDNANMRIQRYLYIYSNEQPIIKIDELNEQAVESFIFAGYILFPMIDYNSIPNPAYVIDEDLLRRNLSLISDVARKSGVKIIPAFKGFALWAVFPIVREYVSGASASSLWEARLAVEEMKSLAHTYAPVYSQDSFDEVLGYSSHITFNSVNQFRRFSPQVRRYNETIGSASSRPPVSMGIRINPEFSEVATALYNPCCSGSRLGVTAAQLEAATRDDFPENGVLPQGIDGLHVHALCESSAQDTANLIEVVEKKFGRLLDSVQWINLGGGHLMTSEGYDLSLLISTLINFRTRHPNLEVLLEPGAAFVWESGVLVARVEDIVENGGIRTAILNISFTAHLPDCLEMPYKPRIKGATDEIAGKPTYRLGGNSCLSGDYIGNWSFDHELCIGEQIVFEDMIHYTMVKTTTFNGVAHPSIGMWNSHGAFVLFKKFDYPDYKGRLS